MIHVLVEAVRSIRSAVVRTNLLVLDGYTVFINAYYGRRFYRRPFFYGFLVIIDASLHNISIS